MGGFRPTIKVKLAATPEAQHAADIIGYWRQRREVARHVARAIGMYYALLKGDTTLLEEYFPFLAAALGNVRTSAPPRRPDARPVITVVEKSDDENVADLLDSLGI